MTNINPAPIREAVTGQNNQATTPWVLWLQDLRNAIQSPLLTLKQSLEPAPNNNEAIMWQASTSGTKDGQPYAQGDVLITSNIDGISKTALVLDYSAL